MFENMQLPKIYKRNGRECYLDPIRKKLIYITPEETVRQKVISFVLSELNVPAEMVFVEQHLSHYGIDSKRRADIAIHKVSKDGVEEPVAIIECKAPEVYLDLKATNQLLDYCDLIGADYAMLTNGNTQFCYRYDQEKQKYIPISSLPEYEDILADIYEEQDLGELPPRIAFDQLERFLKEDFASREEDDYGLDISKLTPMSLAVPVFNLWEGLLDTRVKMPSGDYGMFELIEDYGVRMLSYGNSSGGQFSGPYRSFLVKAGDNTEFYSIGVSTYVTAAKPGSVKTCISVAHDDEKEAHHALQLVVEDNVSTFGDSVTFHHHGRIAVGRMGSGKVDELREFVRARCPKLLNGKNFYLGKIRNDRLWRLDDPEVMDLIVNFISYAMIRDEYREFVKKNR